MSLQTILVANTKKEQTKITCNCLEKAGYRVLIAESGHSTLEMIRDESPDLAILDWKLSDLSGLALIRMIRSDEEIKKIPLILRGIEMKEEDLLIGLEAGADLCLREPFHAEIFVARVRAVLRRCNIYQTSWAHNVGHAI